MSRFIKRSSEKIGLPPGTLIHIGEQKSETTEISIIDYDSKNLSETSPVKVEDTFPLKNTPSITWINVDGIHDIDMISKLGNHFNIHPLTQEDIVNTNHRPKVEEFDHYVYIVLKMLFFDDESQKVKSEQISLIIGETFLISFQEQKGDAFNMVRERIRKGKGRIRNLGTDYLGYCLIDAIVDHYFLILEYFGEIVEEMEESTMNDTNSEIIQDIHELKREMIFLRKQIWPLRDLLGSLIKEDMALISEKTNVFLRDVYDHTIQIMDNIESMRDLLSSILDVYLSMVSNGMNNVMKVLTIIATVFIPLSFIAGVYGMNFKYIPELEWKYGYYLFWGLVGSIFGCMMIYFRKKKWL